MNAVLENVQWRTAKAIKALNKRTEKMVRAEERDLLQRYPYLRGGDKDKTFQR